MASLVGEEPLTLTQELDLIAFGQRLRHLRKQRGLTLSDLGERVSRAPSQLSLLENGKREPKLSLLEVARRRARRAGRGTAAPPAAQPPRPAGDRPGGGAARPALRRARPAPAEGLRPRAQRRARTHPRPVRRAARAARPGRPPPPRRPGRPTPSCGAGMRERGNYFAEIEQAAAEALAAVGYRARRAVAGHAARRW